MRLTRLVLILSVLSLPCSAIAGDAKIAKLVAKLRKDPVWMSGSYPQLDLPKRATPAQVVAAFLDMVGFDAGHIKRYRIRAIEKIVVWEGYGEITFVRISSDLGDKIIAMQYHYGEWWTKALRVS